MSDTNLQPVSKVLTHVPGFDLVSDGGLPKGRVSLVTGTAGSGKTVFALQTLALGITKSDARAVFVTFEETPEDIRNNVAGFGWDIPTWEEEGRFTFVNAAFDPSVGSEAVVGSYDLGALLARIRHAVESTGATLVALDSIGAIFAQFSDSQVIRTELYRVCRAVKAMGATVIVTAERRDDFGEVSRHNVEEFVADSVIILRNALEDEKRRRTLEILKSRGAWHQTGEFPFTIAADRGLVLFPLSAEGLMQTSSGNRATSGIAELDDMCNGGFFDDSLVLVSGATGAGKTLLVTQFLEGGFQRGDRMVLFAFEESRQELFRHALGSGTNLAAMEEAGQLRIECALPESRTPEDHLLRIQHVIEEFQPTRVAVDSVTALERITSAKSFRELVIGLSAYLRNRSILAMYTATTDSLLGAAAITDAHISTVTDCIILLRYVEHRAEILRSITVLRMRGSKHDRTIREFIIDETGVRIGDRFPAVSGILVGNPSFFPEA